mmetsp:Transcript_23710/g.29588  ORF Transcript_23710/g.29588 Transcript_23710/m.29588 type:complete len:239 (+) Transcript_23710:53-769(+)
MRILFLLLYFKIVRTLVVSSKTRIKRRWIEMNTLRHEFLLADEIPRNTVDYNGKKYTFWSGVREASPELGKYSTKELIQIAEEAANRGLVQRTDIGEQAPILEQIQISSNTVYGHLENGSRRVCKNPNFFSLNSVEYLVDGSGDIFEIGSKATTDVSQPPKQVFWGKRNLATLGFILFLVFPLFSAINRPSSQSGGFYYYSETSTSITRRNADGTLDTRTSRDIQTNFNLAGDRYLTQ